MFVGWTVMLNGGTGCTQDQTWIRHNAKNYAKGTEKTGVATWVLTQITWQLSEEQAVIGDPEVIQLNLGAILVARVLMFIDQVEKNPGYLAVIGEVYI